MTQINFPLIAAMKMNTFVIDYKFIKESDKNTIVFF